MAKKEPKPRNVKKQVAVEIPDTVSEIVPDVVPGTVQSPDSIIPDSDVSIGSVSVEPVIPEPVEAAVIVSLSEQEPAGRTRRLNKTQLRRKAYWDDYNAKNGISAE